MPYAVATKDALFLSVPYQGATHLSLRALPRGYFVVSHGDTSVLLRGDTPHEAMATLGYEYFDDLLGRW